VYCITNCDQAYKQPNIPDAMHLYDLFYVQGSKTEVWGVPWTVSFCHNMQAAKCKLNYYLNTV